jgi:hypothetical protein
VEEIEEISFFDLKGLEQMILLSFDGVVYSTFPYSIKSGQDHLVVPASSKICFS